MDLEEKIHGTKYLSLTPSGNGIYLARVLAPGSANV
jgi:hypothetical protein